MTSAGSLEAHLVSDDRYDAWDAFVARQERTGSIYSTAQYLDILCRAAGGTFSIVAVEEGGSLVGGIALYRKGNGAGYAITNRRLLYYNGIVLRDDLPDSATSARSEVLAALNGVLRRQRAPAINLHCRNGAQDFSPFTEAGWRARPSQTIVVPTHDTARLWTRFDKNARRLVRRAESTGCTVDADNDFDSFYFAHEEIHRRKNAPLYLPRQAFRSYADELIAARLGVIFTARVAGGAPAASQLVLLGKHSCSHTVCAGSHAEHLPTGAAYLLRWRAFTELGARGYAANDLTDVSVGPVTRFKEQFGGERQMNMMLRSPRRGILACGTQWYRALRKEAGTLFCGRRPRA